MLAIRIGQAIKGAYWQATHVCVPLNTGQHECVNGIIGAIQYTMPDDYRLIVE